MRVVAGNCESLAKLAFIEAFRYEAIMHRPWRSFITISWKSFRKCLSKKALTNESWNAYLINLQVGFLRISEASTVPHESRELPMPSNAKSPVYPPWNVHNQPRIRYRHKRAQETEKRDRRSSCRNLLGRLVLKWWGCLLYDSSTTPPYSNLPKIYSF